MTEKRVANLLIGMGKKSLIYTFYCNDVKKLVFYKYDKSTYLGYKTGTHVYQWLFFDNREKYNFKNHLNFITPSDGFSIFDLYELANEPIDYELMEKNWKI